MHEPANSILITQCLQNDFVKPIGPHDPLPNRLHVGFSEARRLMGDCPAEGPVAGVMQWACRHPRGELRIIHIRDWHAGADPSQHSHLAQFGDHCIGGTPGAELAFAAPADSVNVPEEIRSIGLNDFHGTQLGDILAPYANRPVHVGLMGVWTEAKIQFLAYELVTRFPSMRVGVCSALTASSSRAGHFLALEQLRHILGVAVFDSIGEFMEFLGGSAGATRVASFEQDHPAVAMEGDARALDAEDERLFRYVFRHCRRVEARRLDGGFSGNVVAGTRSIDLHGHAEATHVVKIGPREAIGRERTAFEQVEEVMGNNAPRITDFADSGARGIVKYRYASMAGDSAKTFQKLYMGGAPADAVREILSTVFEDQLGRLYGAATAESCNLLDYYLFDAKWAPNVDRRVEALLGPSPGENLSIGGRSCRHVGRFYSDSLRRADPLRRWTVPFAFVHGDLNGANIIIDGRQNVWLIDFFHTHRGHVLRDLIKLENDILYIMTPLAGPADLEAALRLSDRLAAVDDLAAPLAAGEFGAGPLARAWETIRILRGFYPRLLLEDQGALQWQVGALRYAVHTLSFDESSPMQKQWALYTAGRLAERLEGKLLP